MTAETEPNPQEDNVDPLFIQRSLKRMSTSLCIAALHWSAVVFTASLEVHSTDILAYTDLQLDFDHQKWHQSASQENFSISI